MNLRKIDFDNLDGMTKDNLVQLIQNMLPDNEEKVRDEVIHDAIDGFFEHYDVPDDIRLFKSKLCQYINAQIELDNATKGRNGQNAFARVKEITEAELIYILMKLDTYKVVSTNHLATIASSELMYKTAGGWYEPALEHITHIGTIMCPKFKAKNAIDVLDRIKALINETTKECPDEDYTPLTNGVFNKAYWDEHHELMPYSDDRVFTKPFAVEFDPDATNPNIVIDEKTGETFNVEDWLLELSAQDESIKECLWDIISAILHPYRAYSKCLMIYNPIGNNGKGTFLELCRNLVGKHLCADMSIEAFADKNVVVNIANARLVAGDENVVNQYVDNSVNFKLAVTSDPITVDRKYMSTLTFSYNGFIIQCMNGLPTTKDKSDSFYRRLLIVPFNNHFEGIERPEIKQKYMKNKKVLQYVLYKALMRDVKELTAPDAAVQMMEEFREDNDTMLQWWKDEGSQVDYAWDRIPYCLLYASYNWWLKRNSVKGDPNMNSSRFKNEFKLKVLPTFDGWAEPDTKDKRFRANMVMKTTPEKLVAKYDCDELKNPNYTGHDWYKIGSDGGQFEGKDGKAKQYYGIVMVK